MYDTILTWKVLICNGPNATGYCEYEQYELEKCFDLKAPLFQNSSTFAPDGDSFYCYPYAWVILQQLRAIP